MPAATSGRNAHPDICRPSAKISLHFKLRPISSPPCRENTMPIYKAPVEDVTFLLNDVFQIDRYDNLPGLHRRLRRCARGDPRRGRQARRGGAAAAQPHRRSRGLQASRRRQRHHAEGFQGGLQAGRRGRLARAVGADGIWRAGPARDAEPGRQRIPVRRPTWRSRCMRGLTQGATAALLVHGTPEQKKTLSCRR